jgi:hypothetical protein
MWYGLTRDEAILRCRGLGLSYQFLETRDPKASTQEGRARVIRAREERGGVDLLLGYFAPEKRGPVQQ